MTIRAEEPQQAIQALDNIEVRTLLQNNHATLAMLRPLAEDNIDPTRLTGTAHETLVRHIQGLTVHKQFSFTFDEQMVNDFYGGSPKRDQLTKPPEHYIWLRTRWHEFMHIMIGGETTGLILHSSQGDAVERWRQQIGHWDVENHRNPKTLRGQFALRNFNNLLHGSDSAENAVHEVDIITNGLKRRLSNG